MYNSCDESGKADKIENLESGKGIQYLLNEAYKILGNPILIHDMEYKIIEYSENVITDDPIWNEYIETGTVGYNWLEFFKNECFLDTAANAKKITFLNSDKLKYNRIYGKVYNKNNIQIGCACMVACNIPFEYDTPEFFEDICDILSEELGKNEFYNDYGQAYLEKLVGELIDGISDKALYTAHVESIYMHLKTNLYLAAVDIRKGDSACTELAYFRDLFKKTQPEYTYAIYSNCILIIIGTDEPVLHVEKDLNRLNRLFYENNIHAGISRSFDNLFELQKYYNEALSALNHGSEITSQQIFLYEQFERNIDD